MLRNRHDGWALICRQVAEECEDDAVLLLDRVGINARTRRRLGGFANRGNARANSVTIEAPTMVGALHGAVIFALATREARATVNACITEDGGLTVFVAKDDEVVTE